MKVKNFKILLVFCLALLLAPEIAAQTKKKYTCPMHPEIVSSKRGTCPKCKMRLVPQTKAKEEPSPTPSPEPNSESTKESSAFSSSKIPDTPVLDQYGKSLSFYSDLIKGKTVAINFVFTTCTAICPPGVSL